MANLKRVQQTVRKDGFGGRKIMTFNIKQAVFHQCKECCGFSRGMVEKCSDELCSLHQFRLPEDKMPK